MPESVTLQGVYEVLERLKEYQPEKIILFGSYARGETDEYSDLDFVVIKKTGKRFLAQEAYVQIPSLNFLCYRFNHLSMRYVAVHARRVEHGFN